MEAVNLFSLGLYFLAVLSSGFADGHSGSHCKPEDETCEFWLDIEERLTSMYGKNLVVPCQGKLIKYSETNCSSAEAIDPSKLIQTDAYYQNPRFVIVANGSLPGPPIEVYYGQNVVIHVRNKMKSEGTTIHWHGLHQRDTPWMDGVAYVTQCPILPGQTFTYRFKADPMGTFWYHSHLGSQRSNGLFGAFIVHEKPKPNAPKIDEHIMILNDWNHDWDSDTGHLKMLYGIFDGKEKYGGTKSVDGAFFSMFKFQSGLVNGQGRYYDPKTGKSNEAPLHVYKVTKGQRYRFRVISAGVLYPFRVSVDGHKITLVSSDGAGIVPLEVESFIINPGERFDFLIDADQDVGNYLVRSVTLEEITPEHIAEAIFRYDGASMEDPKTSRRPCTADDKCMVFNCPFSYYPPDRHTECLTFNDVQAAPDVPYKMPVETGTEYFLNFAFPGNSWTPGSVNGRQFSMPTVSALTQPEMLTHECLPENCGDQKICTCNYNVTTSHDETITMIFSNIGSGKGWSHPVHMHGHFFWVLKMGYAQYNPTTAKIEAQNEDIDCRGQSFCNGATWKDPSWSNGQIPGANYVNPPLKDTLIVPTGGYALVRIKADNPGLWLMHCHIELHNLDGMAMTILEAPDHIPREPYKFPECGNFLYKEGPDEPMPPPPPRPSPPSTPKPSTSGTDGENKVEKVTETEKDEDSDFFSKKEYFWIVVIILIGVILLQFLVNILLIMRRPTSSRSNENMRGAYNPGFDGSGAKF